MKTYYNESDLMRQIQVAVSRLGHRLLRNNSAVGWVGVFAGRTPDGTVTLRNARPLHAGLGVGSSDLIGFTNTGRFLAIECKSSSGRASTEQINFINTIKRSGGLAGIARSIKDAEDIIRGKQTD